MKHIIIDEHLVRKLIDEQIPQWKHLPIYPVAYGGWDNRTFHLGDHMLVRMPSAQKYADKVEKEQYWLPILAPLLPYEIPTPVFMGKPGYEYHWNWSVYRWIAGETAMIGNVDDMCMFARDLAHFLKALHAIESTGGPQPGAHNFYRGGSLAYYDTEVRQALELLKDKLETKRATEIWKSALATHWQGAPVWVHGDVNPGNILVRDGKLCAVIDFGGLAVGDPACDLAIAWTFFDKESRAVFRAALDLDDATWTRGRAWALWKAVIRASELVDGPENELESSWRVIEEIKISL